MKFGFDLMGGLAFCSEMMGESGTGGGGRGGTTVPKDVFGDKPHYTWSSKAIDISTTPQIQDFDWFVSLSVHQFPTFPKSLQSSPVVLGSDTGSLFFSL